MFSPADLEKIATIIPNSLGTFEYELLKDIVNILGGFKTYEQTYNALVRSSKRNRAILLSRAIEDINRLAPEQSLLVIGELEKITGIKIVANEGIELLDSKYLSALTKDVTGAYQTTYKNAAKSAYAIGLSTNVEKAITTEIDRFLRRGVTVLDKSKQYELFGKTTQTSLTHLQKVNLQSMKNIARENDFPNLVLISYHSDASPDHALYQGKVYVNDVEVI